MQLVIDALPPRGNEVRIQGTFVGENAGYWLLDEFGETVWWEAVDGPDVLVLGVVETWERNLPPGR